MLITISGIDGSGKSTLANKLEHSLICKGYKVKQIEFPCSKVWTNLQLLQEKGDHYEVYGNCSQSVGLALNLERLSFIKEVVCPNVDIYQIVILQRYLLDFASIGYAQDAGENELLMINDMEKVINTNSISFFLDTDQEVAFQRIQERGASLDIRETESFHKKLYDSYHNVFSKGLFPCVRINGNLSSNEVVRDVLERINFL